MKRIVAFLFAMLLALSTSYALAEAVVQKTYTISTAEYSHSGLYTGEMTNGKPHGYGLFNATNSTGVPWHYIGYWENGMMSGEGGIYWDDGNFEIGIYQNGVMISGTKKDGNDKSIAGASNASDKSSQTYIGNINSKKFHRSSCSSVSDMKDKNKVTLNSRDEAIKNGYTPCKQCNP